MIFVILFSQYCQYFFRDTMDREYVLINYDSLKKPVPDVLLT